MLCKTQVVTRRRLKSTRSVVAAAVWPCTVLSACTGFAVDVESACVQKWNADPPIEGTQDGSTVDVLGDPPLRGDTDYNSCTVLVMEPDGFCASYWAAVDETADWQQSGCTLLSGSRLINQDGLIQ